MKTFASDINWSKLTEYLNSTKNPAIIQSDKGNVVVMSEKEYDGWQETIELYKNPKIMEEILIASQESIEECVSHEEVWGITTL